MFTIISVPQTEWDENGGSNALALFGLAGAIIGAIYAGVYALLGLFGINPLIIAPIIAFLPSILSGFLHLDGFMDVSDAVLSHRSREERLKILKDAHCGSFAVVMLVILSSVLLFASCSVVKENVSPIAIAMIPIVSRSAAAIALLSLPPLEGSSLGTYFTKNKKPRHTVISALILAVSMILAAVFGGVGCAVAGFIVYSLSLLSVYHSLRGINGDVTGFLVCVTEAAMLAGCVL